MVGLFNQYMAVGEGALYALAKLQSTATPEAAGSARRSIQTLRDCVAKSGFSGRSPRRYGGSARRKFSDRPSAFSIWRLSGSEPKIGSALFREMSRDAVSEDERLEALRRIEERACALRDRLRERRALLGDPQVLTNAEELCREAKQAIADYLRRRPIAR